MFINEVQIRVRYAETDQMGYVYYGNYATYFEVSRVESLRKLGISYKALEDSGVMLPVLDYSCKYIKPVLYDELLTIRTTINKIPQARIFFEYEVFNEAKELTTLGNTTLVFIKRDTKKPCLAPTHLISLLEPFF